MSCIITYKGQKYSEEQFKEYFINNKQEFVTSIAKNKNVINSFKRKMEGIDVNLYSQYLSQNPNGNVEQFKSWLDNNQTNVQYQLPQSREIEEFIASEKTIRDLAARMSDRIGIPVKYISDRSQHFKGKLENGTAVINLAYATLDTPIHEILGHPIIRAIKDKSNPWRKMDRFELNGDFYVYDVFTGYSKEGKTISKDEYIKAKQEFNKKHLVDNNLYQNLLKELEYGKGKEVLDRIKIDYTNKNQYKKEDFSIEEDEQFDIDENRRVKRFTILNSKNLYAAQTIFKNIEDARKELERLSKVEPYTLEEQQEEAVVELLGLYTADRLDKVKDGKLISLLKRLLKEIKSFVRSLLTQREVEIDKLPDSMMLGDIADLLAYSNSKLILPGNEVIYTTPDNQQFKTYAEASKHISDLAKSVEDVDLSDVGLESMNIDIIDKFNNNKQINQVYSDYIQEPGLNVHQVIIIYTDGTTIKYDYDSLPKDQFNFYRNIELNKSQKGALNNFIHKNKEYEQSKEIIEEWKKVNNIQYNPEEIYSRSQEFVSVVGAYSNFDVNLMMQNLLQHIEDNQKAGGEFTISVFTKPVDKQIGHLEGGGGKIKFKIYPQSKDIKWAANTDVYSGSVWDASEKVSKDKKSELLGVSYTKYPSLQNVNAVQPNLAAIVDNLVHHHNELGIALTGGNFRLEYDEDIPYFTKKIINSINSILDSKFGKLVKPVIENKSKNKEITLKEVYENIKNDNYEYSYQDDKYFNKLSREFNLDTNQDYYELKSELLGRIEEILKVNPDVILESGAKQPTQTNETLKESIESVKNRINDGTFGIKSLSARLKFEQNKIKILQANIDTGNKVEESKTEIEKVKVEINRLEELIKNPPQKEYTEQALINTKIAKLKEVAKKYPKSLIRSEVRSISSSSNLGFAENELPFQKVSGSPFQQFQQSLNKPNTNPILQGNQQEQVKKFNELQERLNNKEFLEGAKNAFESSRELQELGTQEEYSSYIARVSLGIIKNPSSGEYNYESKVQDIVYHGTNLNFNKFDKTKIGGNTAVKGEKPSFSFSNNKQQAEAYSSEITVGQNTNELAEAWFKENQHVFKNGDINTGVIDINNVFDHYKKELGDSKEMISLTEEIDPITDKYKLIPVNDKNLKELSEIKTKEWQQEYNTLLTAGARVMSVILNIKTPKIVDFEGEKKSAKFKEEQLSAKGDAFIAKNIDDWGKGDVIQVFEPEQIHILSSKADIEGFKEFVKSESNRGFNTILLQKKNTESSKASPETIKKVKEFLQRIGVSFKSVQEILVNGQKQDANAVARIMQNLIEVVEGKENVALIEESMHFAIELIEQKNPKLFNTMLTKIGKYNIYQETLSVYKDNKLYQKDGKPDIRKIKKEAIAKLLAEQIIFQSEGFTEKPELLAQSSSWWEKIVDFLKNLFKKPGFNPFEQVAQQIITKTENLGQAYNLSNSDSFLQIGHDATSEKQLEIINALKEQTEKFNIRKVIDEEALNEDDRNFYERLTEEGSVRLPRVTKIVEHRVGVPEFTEEQKKINKVKAEWGTKGHKDIENIITAVLKDGKLISQDSAITAIQSIEEKLDRDSFNLLVQYLIGTKEVPGILYQLPPNTHFITEQVLYNPNYKSKKHKEIVGTVDLIAVLPDGKVRILDWKFMGIDLNRYSDVPPYKTEQYKAQLREYKKILVEAYNVPETDIFTLFVPIRSVYTNAQDKDVVLKSIQIGSSIYKNEYKAYLLPKSGDLTGIAGVDALIKSLTKQLNELNNKKALTAEEKTNKAEQIKVITWAVNHLQISQNFAPLLQQILVLNKKIEGLKANADLYTRMPLKDNIENQTLFNNYIDELLKTVQALKTYEDVDRTFEHVYGHEGIAEQELFSQIKEQSRQIRSIKDELSLLHQDLLYKKLSEQANTSEEELKAADKIITGLVSEYTIRPARQQTAAFRAASTLIQRAKNSAQLEGIAKIRNFEPLLKEFYNWARTKGKDNISAWELIMKKDKHELISVIDPQYFKEFKQAQKDKDSKWFLKNIDIKKYKEKADKYLISQIDRINNYPYQRPEGITDEQWSTRLEELKDRDIEGVKAYLDISSPSSKGWGNILMDDYDVIIKEKWYSKEYKEIQKNEPALKIFEFIQEYNKYAKSIGYLSSDQHLNFLPFLRAGFVDRIKNLDFKGYFSDQFTVLVDEESEYGRVKVNEFTGELERSLNKRFTNAPKNEKGEIDKKAISKDIGISLVSFIAEVEKYRAKSLIEPLLLSLEYEERLKGHLEADEQTGNVVFENDLPKIFPGNEANFSLLRDYINDALYEIANRSDQLIHNKFKNAQDLVDNVENKTAISSAKIFETTRNLFQMQVLGLNLFVAIPNFFGANIQGIINSRNYYKGREFAGAEIDMLLNKLSLDKKNVTIGLLDYFIPLNEDISQLKEVNKLSGSALRKFSVKDFLSILHRKPDHLIQYSNALAFLKNTIVVNGELKNIRQHLREQPEFKNRYQNNNIKDVEGKAFEDKVKELQKQSILNIAVVTKTGLEIPGIKHNSQTVQDYRNLIINHGKRITAQISRDNRAKYASNFLLRSFFTMKTWIEPMASARFSGIKYDAEFQRYEYGRILALKDVMSTAFLNIPKHISNITNVLSANKKGIEILNKLYQEKAEEYYQKTGKKLNMSEQEFYDMMRTNVRQELKELIILMSMVAIYFGIHALAPDDDDDDKQKKNVWKVFARVSDKIVDELSFYYLPSSFDHFTSGSFVPQMSIFKNITRFTTSAGKEILGQITDNEKWIEGAHPTKNFLKIFPVTTPIVNLIPMLDPELAKEMAIQLQENNNRR